MRHLVLALTLACLAPFALAAPDVPVGFGSARLEIHHGCPAPEACHPDEYAWVDATACLREPGGARLEVARLLGDIPASSRFLPAAATGDALCPYLVQGTADTWAGLFQSPLDCVEATLIAPGTSVTRVSCASDL